MAIILATDLDGTLFYPKKPFVMVSKENRKLLKTINEHGDRVVVVSSRSRQFYDHMRKKIGMDFDFVGTDGTFVSVGGKTIRDEFFDPQELNALVNDLRNEYDPPLFLATSAYYPNIINRTRVSKFTNFAYFMYQMVQGTYREKFIRSDQVFFREIASGKVCKLMVLIGLTKKKKQRAFEITNLLSKKYPQFQFVWLNQFIEITPRGCSKASGLKFYLDYLDLNHDNVFVVGDSGNDVPMFDAFKEHSFAMEHASPEVKSHASQVIRRVHDLQQVLYPSADSKK